MSNDKERDDLNYIRETLEALFEQRENASGRVPAALRAVDRVCASLAASAGREPVSEVECDCTARDMPFGTCCKVRKAFEQWYDAQPDGRLQPFDVWRAAWGRRFTHPSPPEGMVGGWRPIETRPANYNGSYLLANSKGQVAPVVDGVIRNKVGTANDWQYGEAATHWQPLPAPPLAAGGGREADHE